jgi:disulfide bond formation protein DsbB
MKHVGMQFGTGDFSCEFFANFPPWFKLDEWFPAVFTPTGYCDDIQWQLFGFTMPQWMLGIYAAYLLSLAVALIAEIRKPAGSGRKYR